MASEYRPKPWLRETPTGDQRPVSIQSNIYLPPDAGEADKAVLMGVAASIVETNGGNIDRFMAVQRQNVALSGRAYHDAKVTMEGMNARYRWNMGQEKLNLEIYPVGGQEQSATTSEVNFDGYLCWVHVEPTYPNIINNKPQSQNAYAIIMNGYVFESNYTPVMSETHAGGYPMLFGKTALLCSSYVGDKEQLNPLVLDSDYKQPFKVIPSPPGNYVDGVSPSGVEQDSIQKTFGYWLFDWLNDHNPFQYIGVTFSYGQPPQWYSWNDLWNSIGAGANSFARQPVFDRGIYFPSSKANNSPLRPLGQNGISVIPAAGAPPAIDWAIAELFFGEFYDRGKFRIVSQSWSIPREPNTTIAINDAAPLLYGRASYQNGYTAGNGAGFTFNLDPASTAQDKSMYDNDDRVIGIHDGLISDVPTGLYSFDGLSAAQKAQVDDWIAQNQQITSAFEAQLIAEIKAVDDQIQAAQDDVMTAHDLAYILRTGYGQFDKYTTGIYKTWLGDKVDYIDPANPGTPQSPNYLTHAGGPIYDAPTQSLELVVTWVHTQTGPPLPVTTDDQYTYGGLQQFYLIVGWHPPEDHESFKANAANGALWGPPWVDPKFNTVQVSSTTTGQGTSVVVTTTVNQIVDVTPGSVSDGKHKVFGPSSSYRQLMQQADDWIMSVMSPYDDLLTQLDDLYATKPPNLLPFPSPQGGLSDFKYSYISISGGSWSFNQNP